MPIKGLLERGGGARYPRLGIIRLGIKVRNAQGKEFPREVPYFVLPEDLAEHLPENPTSIDVAFPSDDIERVFDVNYIKYAGPFLAVKCDGEQATYISDKGGEVVKPCERPAQGPCTCGAKALGRLNVIVRKAQAIGIYQIPIGGESRCRMLMSELLLYQAVLARAGLKLSQAWFTLERTKTDVQVRKADGTRVVQQGYPVHVRLHYAPTLVLGEMSLTPSPVEDDEDGTPEIALEASPPEAMVTRAETVLGPQDAAKAVPPAHQASLLDEGDEGEPTVTPVEDWTLTTMISVAVDDLGVTEETYRRYLESVYGDATLLTADMVDDQRAFLEAALRSADGRRAAAAAITAVGQTRI